MISSPNEAASRALQIDPQLRVAGWNLNDRTPVRLEVPVDGYDAEPWNGVTDYCMHHASGDVLAVVEQSDVHARRWRPFRGHGRARPSVHRSKIAPVPFSGQENLIALFDVTH